MSSLPPWIGYVGRFGQAAKGLVYVSIGLIAAQAVWTGDGEVTGSRGVIRALADQPFGRVLLFALVGGLGCYVLWRILEAVADADEHGSGAKGLVLRARSLLVAAIYGGLTFAAAKTLLGHSTRGDSDAPAQDWTARAMAQPLGATLVVLVGAGIIIFGLYLIYRGYREEFEKDLDLADLQSRARKCILRICVFGLVARGIVFCIIGGFLIQAGLHSNAEEARGLTGALQALRAQPYGRWLFAVVAAGLAAYGLYNWVRAYYGRWGPRQS